MSSYLLLIKIFDQTHGNYYVELNYYNNCHNHLDQKMQFS